MADLDLFSLHLPPILFLPRREGRSLGCCSFLDSVLTFATCSDSRSSLIIEALIANLILPSVGDLVLTIWLGVTVSSVRGIGRGYASLMMFVPALLGSILVNTLPGQNKVGLLFAYWVSSKFSSSCDHGCVFVLRLPLRKVDLTIRRDCSSWTARAVLFGSQCLLVDHPLFSLLCVT